MACILSRHFNDLWCEILHEGGEHLQRVISLFITPFEDMQNYLFKKEAATFGQAVVSSEGVNTLQHVQS